MKTKLSLSPVRRSLKSVGGFLLLTLFSLLLLSCNLFGPNTTTYDVTLSPGETYDINLGQSSDEEGVLITDQPLHGLGSGTWRDTTSYEMHFMYVPDSGYVGTDYVKIALVNLDLEPSWSSEYYPDIQSYVEFNFTIEEPADE